MKLPSKFEVEEYRKFRKKGFNVERATLHASIKAKARKPKSKWLFDW